MKKYEISKEEYEAIKEREKATRDKKVSERLKVLMLIYEGYKVSEITRITGINKSGIYRLYNRYREQGLEEYVRNKHTSHRRVLSEAEEKEILNEFEKAAEAGQVVTAQDIKKAFDQKIGRDTGSVYIYRLLKRHGWRKVMPRSRHPKAANEEACEASKKLSKACWKREKSASRTPKERFD